MDDRISRAIKFLMEDRKVSATAMIERSGVSRTNFYRHLNGENEPDIGTRELYAAALRISIDEFEQAWRGMEKLDKPRDAIAFLKSKGMDKKKKAPRMLPEYSGVSAVSRGVTSAKPVAEVEAGEFEGEFVVPLDGQCMEPRYSDGERVVLSVERWKADGGFRDNVDYLVCFTDGSTTFKRVVRDPLNDDYLWFIPLNEDEKHKRWKEHRKKVRFAARWMGTMPPRVK